MKLVKMEKMSLREKMRVKMEKLSPRKKLRVKMEKIAFCALDLGLLHFVLTRHRLNYGYQIFSK